MVTVKPPNGQCSESNTYVELSLLDGGSFIGELKKLHAGVQNGNFRMYNWAFHVRHQERHILWDLGLDQDRECYTPWVKKHMLDEISHVGPRKSIVDQLGERGVLAEQIDTVLFSHAHWDHCRPISKTFPNATAYFGPGTKDACSPGHLADSNFQWDGRFFDPKHATERWEELDGNWVSFGPFDKALDYFGDGSFWIIQAPGHMPGNLCAAARLKQGDWVVLGSDCCHSRELLDGKYEIAEFCIPGFGEVSLHSDLPAAKDTIARMRILEKKFGFHIALAHDAAWMKDGTDGVLMSLLDEHMKIAAKERIPRGEIP